MPGLDVNIRAFNMYMGSLKLYNVYLIVHPQERLELTRINQHKLEAESLKEGIEGVPRH